MVKSKQDLKNEIKLYTRRLQAPFTTDNVVEHCREIASHMSLSGQRIARYITQAQTATFDKSTKKWTPQDTTISTKPIVRLSKDRKKSEPER